jgi:Uncharacterized protein conserved in bacteria
MRTRPQLPPRAESIFVRTGLIRPASWAQALAQDPVLLYAGDLPRDYPQYSRFFGITPFRPAARNICHDLRQPLPIPAASVDVFQAEDVFEHIELESIPSLLNEIYRVLKPGGLLRLSVPDYNFKLYRDRTQKDGEGKLLFDPGGGGRLEGTKVVGGGHLWFPTITTMRHLMAQSSFQKIDFLQYRDSCGRPVNTAVDHSLAPVKRSAELDPRGRSEPVSIIIDARKLVNDSAQPLAPRPTASAPCSSSNNEGGSVSLRMKNISKLIAPAAIVRAARSLRQRRRAE